MPGLIARKFRFHPRFPVEIRQLARLCDSAEAGGSDDLLGGHGSDLVLCCPRPSRRLLERAMMTSLALRRSGLEEVSRSSSRLRLGIEAAELREMSDMGKVARWCLMSRAVIVAVWAKMLSIRSKCKMSHY
jgi:hypothetical protein